MRFNNVEVNSRKPRRGKPGPGCAMSLTDFASWFAHQDLRCHYCTIPEELLELLGLRTSIGLPLKRLGIDRLDNAQPYTPANIALCCYACNKVKSNTFTTAEMAALGPSIAAQWAARLAAAGVTWSPSPAAVLPGGTST